MGVSRSQLEAMDRDEITEQIFEISQTVDDQQETIEHLQAVMETLILRRKDMAQRIDDLEDDRQSTEGLLHRERSKVARRVAALEDEIGITATDALATAEAGQDSEHLSKLARLIRHGPKAVSENPGGTLFRTRELVENWDRWGTVRDDALGKERRLASKKHDLLTRLEDALNESLEWTQVYRAMEWIDRESGPNVTLQEGSSSEGKYVLVHRLEADDQ